MIDLYAIPYQFNNPNDPITYNLIDNQGNVYVRCYVESLKDSIDTLIKADQQLNQISGKLVQALNQTIGKDNWSIKSVFSPKQATKIDLPDFTYLNKAKSVELIDKAPKIVDLN